MKLLFKQRFFSLLGMDNFDIYDEAGNKAYVVEGQFSLTHHLKIYDGNDNYMGSIKQHFLTQLGNEAAEHVCRRACLAVELAGKDISDDDRAVFYQALTSITENLQKLSQQGLPE